MRNVWITFVIGAALGAISTYVLVGGASEPEPSAASVEEAAPVKAAAPEPPSPVDVAATPKAAQVSADACRATLAAVRQAHAEALQEDEQNEELIAFLGDLVEKSGAASPSGNPMEFPDGLDPKHTPETFEKSVERLKEECPDVFPEETQSDCSEFPCTIRFPDNKSARGTPFHEQCPLATELFGNSMSSSSTSLGEVDGQRRYLTEIMPTPSGTGIDEHLEEYRGNLQKRRRHRFDEWTSNYARETYGSACEDEGDPTACRLLGRQLERTDPGAANTYTEKACDLGDANACNNLAWTRCHDNGQCDATALRLASRAAELDPNSAAILDTMAFVLCARGDQNAGGLWYEKSCQAGMQKNCGRTCK